MPRLSPCSLWLLGALASTLSACPGGGGGGSGSGSDSGSDSEGSSTGSASSGGSTDTPTSTGSTTGAELPPGCDVLVSPGADDQAALQGALIDAAEGSTICLAEGVFMLNSELSISVNGVTLKGASRDATILDYSTQDLGANGMKISGDGVTIMSLTVRETPGDGIRGDNVKDTTYDDVSVEWAAKQSMDNGAYGFYPVGCDGVVIRKSRVIGARDAGIYVGQSTNILVEDCEAYDNVAGIEIENSTGATVRNNHAHDNTGGILIFNLPGLPVQNGKHTLAYGNIVEDNNSPNFGVPGTAVSEVPVGVGFMILSSDENELRGNTVRNNNTAGLIIVSYNELLFEPAMDPNFNAYAEGNYVHDNTFEGNGEMPDVDVAPIFGTPAPDILDDGCEDPDKTPGPELVNCVYNNGAATWMDFDLCGGFMNKNTDIMTATCQHAELPELPGG